MFFNKIMKRNLIISSLAYDLLKGVHYGYYIPGHYYHLLHYGEKNLIGMIQVKIGILLIIFSWMRLIMQ